MTSDTPPSPPAQSDPMVGANWDGLPENPKQSRWHWLRARSGGVNPWFWDADYDGAGEGIWAEEGGEGAPAEFARAFTYVGPCLTPDEITALRRDTPAAGGGTGEGTPEMLEAGFKVAHRRLGAIPSVGLEDVLRDVWRAMLAATPPTPDRAPATEGGEAMREACAKAVEDMIYGGHCGEERDEARDRNRRNNVLRAVARALRALPTPADSAEFGCVMHESSP